MHLDDEGNMIVEPVGPGNPGAKKVYRVANPDGVVDEYWFTDADIMAIATQFNNYQQALKNSSVWPT